jgi:hypothetical protein
MQTESSFGVGRLCPGTLSRQTGETKVSHPAVPQVSGAVIAGCAASTDLAEASEFAERLAVAQMC